MKKVLFGLLAFLAVSVGSSNRDFPEESLCEKIVHFGFLCATSYDCRNAYLFSFKGALDSTGNPSFAYKVADFCYQRCIEGVEIWTLKSAVLYEDCLSRIRR